MEREEIVRWLFDRQDAAYGDLQHSLIPQVPRDRFIGVRTPDLRAMVKELYKQGEGEGFLRLLPHWYFEENQLHAFLLSEEKDFARCIARVEAFLPCVDNWATCDQLLPGVFGKHKAELLARIRQWLASDRVYTVRFGLGMLMRHFMDADFDPAYPEWAAALRSEEYYVNMMIAWYFATALAKQYDAALPYIENRRLAPWTHNKAIQKAAESFRVTPEHKAYLKSLKIHISKGNG